MTNSWNYLFGYVIIKIEGPNLEKFINLAINRGVDLWDIKRADNLIIAKTRINSFKSLKPLVRKTRCSVKMLRKIGLPFVLFRLGKRKGLVTAGVLFLAILYILSSFIWFIEIEGNKKVDPRLILQVAAQEGLKSGVLKEKFDSKSVEGALVAKIPDVAWAGINIYGTKATIQVEERVRVEIDKDKIECLVAAQDGLITQLLVISGQPLVREGDTVKKGQMLIAGLPPLNKDQGATHARGRIKARVWYEHYQEAYLKEEIRNRTGEVAKALWVKIGDHFYLLRGRPSSPYACYDQEIINKKMPSWQQYKIPFAWRIVKYYEVKLSYKEYSLEQIKKKIRDETLTEIVGRLKPGTKITSEDVIFLEDQNKKKVPGLVSLKVNLETLEDIGKIEPLIITGTRKGSQKK